MIYFCADDFGLCEDASGHILSCIEKEAINKVSVFPNFDNVDISALQSKGSIMICLHLNLVEGKCMAEQDRISLLADKDGNFKHTFGGLLKLSILKRKEFENQAYKEIKAQVLYWKNKLSDGTDFCIDSHQHVHMIPAVFGALMKVLDDEGIIVKYIRIPAEPLSVFIKTPSLYLTYSAVNVIKQWLLKLLWVFNKKKAKAHNLPTSLFFGILFSGRMDEKRVRRLLPKYIKLANKKKRDIEVLFHPGYTKLEGINLKDKNVVFKNFYLSDNRKTEYDSVTNIKEGSV